MMDNKAVSTKVVKSTCKGCHGGCGVLITVTDGVVTHIEGNEEAPTRGTMCAKGLASIQHRNHPGRIVYPQKRIGERGGGRWQRIGWDEALETITGKMKQNIDQYGPGALAVTQGTGRGYNRYTIRLNNSIRATYGDTGSFRGGGYCFLPRLAMTSKMVTGPDHRWSKLYCDYHGWGGEFPKTQVIWAKQLEIGNTDGEMAVWFLSSLAHAKNIIVIDPRATPMTAQPGSLWLRIRPGTDDALALGFLHVMINEEIYDRDFVDHWTMGFDKLKERVQEYDPRRVSEITWIPAEKIVSAARLIAREGPTTFQYGEPLEAQNNTAQTHKALICLMAITGNIERPGGMVCWEPALGEPIERFMEIPGVMPEVLPPREDGKTPLFIHGDEAVKRLIEGTSPLRQVHAQGGNPLQFLANTSDVVKAIGQFEFISVADIFMSPTAEFADVVLPVAHWLEIDDIYNMHPRFFVGAINKAVEPPGEAWSDARIVNEIGRRIAPEHWFDTVEEMLDAQLQLKGSHLTWPEFSAKGFVAKTGKQQRYYKYKTDYWREGGGFGPPSGKFEFYSPFLESLGHDPLPYYIEPNESPKSTPDLAKDYPLILTTGARKPFFFHSQYRQIPWLRRLQPDPQTQINPRVATDLGIRNGDWIWIETPRGKIRQRAHVTDATPPQMVQVQHGWWYPEDAGPLHGMESCNANYLTSNELPADPVFGSPSYRNLLCRVRKAVSQTE